MKCVYSAEETASAATWMDEGAVDGRKHLKNGRVNGINVCVGFCSDSLQYVCEWTDMES